MPLHLHCGADAYIAVYLRCGVVGEGVVVDGAGELGF